MLFLDEESSKITSAAEAANLMQLTAGMNACSTPCKDAANWSLLHLLTPESNFEFGCIGPSQVVPRYLFCGPSA